MLRVRLIEILLGNPVKSKGVRYRRRESRSDNDNHVERRYLENRATERERKKHFHLHPISLQMQTRKTSRVLTSCCNILVRYIILAAQEAHPLLDLLAIRQRHASSADSYISTLQHDELLEFFIVHKARSDSRDDRFPELPPSRSTTSRRGSRRSNRSSRRSRPNRCRYRRLGLTHQQEPLPQRL
jgi:hypothetical protein